MEPEGQCMKKEMKFFVVMSIVAVEVMTLYALFRL